MSGLDQIQNTLLKAITKLNGSKTGEKNITIEKSKLIERIEAINPGYLEVIELEAPILVRQGLFHGYFKGDEILFDIPDWDKFISAVNAFYEVCYKQSVDDDIKEVKITCH